MCTLKQIDSNTSQISNWEKVIMTRQKVSFEREKVYYLDEKQYWNNFKGTSTIMYIGKYFVCVIQSKSEMFLPSLKIFLTES